MRYWLIKSEPSSYAIDDLKRDKKTYWNGVRNYQARNFMRDQMKSGDRVIFYHSNAEPSGAAGTARVCKEGYPDFTAWDKKDIHYDPKSPQEKPQWVMVDVEFESQFKNFVSLEQIKNTPALKTMVLVRPGSRLSVQPVEKEHFEMIRKMGA